MIAELATRQHGCVARWQLLGAGLTRHQIEHRAGTGRLHALGAGVYAVGHTALTPRSRLAAHVLRFGPGAAADRQAAAWLWNCDGPRRPEAVVDGRSGRNRRGLRVVRALPAADVTVRDGIPCLQWWRMLRDLRATDARLRHVIERLVQDGHFDLDRLDVDRRPQLRRVLAEIEDLPDRVRSDGEAALLAALRAAGLPDPRRDVLVAGHLCDFAWPGARYALELDSRWHDGPWRRRADARRDRDLRDAGWVVDRVDATEPAAEVVALVTRRLAAPPA